MTSLDRYAVALVEARQLAADGSGRQIRLTARLSLSEVATACGVTTPTIHRWETGARRPRGPAAVRYAQLLGALAQAESRAAS
jgi:DNA-binding transcriptional regulator YiaG